MGPGAGETGQLELVAGRGQSRDLKNGRQIKITGSGEIQFDAGAAEAALGRKLNPGEKPAAAFQRLGHDAIISLTDKGPGEIHHEAWHAAMSLALNKNQYEAVTGGGQPVVIR